MTTLVPNYSVGNVIQSEDYDLFVTGDAAGNYNEQIPNLGVVWGAGRGRFGYGQDPVYIAPVQAGDLIRAQHWDNIDAALLAVIQHQGGSYTPLSGAAISSGVTISPVAQFDTAIQDAYNNVGNIYAVSDSSSYSTVYNGIWGHTGARDLRFVQTVAFADADRARYFFNSGGKIKLNFSRTGGTSKARNSFWSGLCAGAGTVEIGYRNTVKVAGSSTGYGQYGGNYGGYDNNNYFALNNNNGGFWGNEAGVTKLHFRQNSSGYGPYSDAGYAGYTGNTPDCITVEVRVYGNPGSNGGLGYVVELTTLFQNDTVVTPSSQDTIDGIATTNLVISTPGSNYLTASWGSLVFDGAVSAI